MEQRFAVFESKPDFNPKSVTIERTIHLPAEEYEQFLAHPMDKYVFLRENVEDVYKRQGISLPVTRRHWTDMKAGRTYTGRR